MNDIFDYLKWRGDLTFGNAPLCPVDTLIFSLLSYLDLRGILPEEAKGEPLRLADVAAAYQKRPTPPKNAIGSEERERLLREAAATARFGSLRLFGAQYTLDQKSGMQFGAVSFLLPGQNVFLAFEGTDDTLTGWKEDFRMSYECPVPAQLRALAYLREVAAAYPLRRLFLGGHSKGGNLAMYAGVHAGEGIRTRIRAIYNHDGPGFCENVLGSAPYLEMRPRIHTYLPESSIVGVLLEHDTNYKIVKSHRRGLLQHDAFTWLVEGPDFVFSQERTAFGKRTEAIIDRFLAITSPDRKKQFCEAVFRILEASEQHTLSGIMGSKRQSFKNILSAYAELPDDVRQLLSDTVAALNTSRRVIEKQQKSSALLLPNTEKSS